MSRSSSSFTPAPSMVRCSFLEKPPSSGSFSTRTTSKPWSPRALAAVMPATPPPITRARGFTGTTLSSRGRSREARATAARTRSMALIVARSGLSEWTQESWLRMLAISKRYLLRPMDWMVS